MKLTSNGFTILRSELFLGSLAQTQVQGIEFLVKTCEDWKLTYPETAYLLATVFHETDKTMQPVVERGSDKYLSKYDTGKLAKSLGNTPIADGDGQRYKGRGYCQITGYANYKNFSAVVGVDLVAEPELALTSTIAAKIIVIGMLNGSFTGVGFRRKAPVLKYDLNSYVNARRIINGSDKALTIGNYALIFEKALRSL